MRIRLATRADFPRIAEMGEPFWAQCAVSKWIPYDRESIIHWCRVMHSDGVLLVVEIDGRVEGATGCVIAPALGNIAYTIGAEMFWWIEPDHRGGGIGKKLMRALEESAMGKGCAVFSMMAMEGIDTEAVQALYLKEGYQPTERAFTKGLVQWDSPPLSQ